MRHHSRAEECRGRQADGGRPGCKRRAAAAAAATGCAGVGGGGCSQDDRISDEEPCKAAGSCGCSLACWTCKNAPCASHSVRVRILSSRYSAWKPGVKTGLVNYLLKTGLVNYLLKLNSHHTRLHQDAGRRKDMYECLAFATVRSSQRKTIEVKLSTCRDQHGASRIHALLTVRSGDVILYSQQCVEWRSH
jgi:hypothetical protein